LATYRRGVVQRFCVDATGAPNELARDLLVPPPARTGAHRRALTSPRPNGCRANRAFRSRTSALRPVVAPSARSIGACASTAGVSASALHLVAVLSAPDPILRPAPDPRAVQLAGDNRNPPRPPGEARRRRERRRRSSSAPLRS